MANILSGDPNNIPTFITDPYETLSRDLYEQLMVAYQALIFDGPFGPTQNREVAAVAVRARKILGIGDANGNSVRRS